MQLVSIIFFAAVGIQLLYLIFFLIAFARRRIVAASETPPVSVIVCAHDEEENLRELIPKLLSQHYPTFEVIVVNDRSNDGTYDYLLQATQAHPLLRMVQVDRVPGHANGKKFGITLGIKAAAHEWVLFTDADCRPADTEWIMGMSRHFQDKVKIVAGVSPYQKEPGFLNLFVRFEGWIAALQYLGFALLGSPYMGVGRNLAYRKSLFLEKKGFNQFLGVVGGDDDLFVNQHATAENLRVEMDPKTTVFSVPKKTWKSFYQQKVRHLSVGKYYRLKHRILLGFFAISWIITWLAGSGLIILDLASWACAATLSMRVTLLIILLRTLSRRTGTPFEWWAVPLLDFLYSFYYISTGLTALSTKKIQWTK